MEGRAIANFLGGPLGQEFNINDGNILERISLALCTTSIEVLPLYFYMGHRGIILS